MYKERSSDKHMKKLLVLTGRSCAGKTTFSNYLKKHYHINEAVSFTAREKRINEIDGVDYNFVSKEEFENKIKAGELVDYTLYHGNYYGLMQDSFNIKMDNVVVVDNEGVKNLLNSEYIKKHFKVVIIQVDETDNIILKRLKARGMSAEEIKQRFEKDKIAFANIPYDYLINSPMFLIDAIAKQEGIKKK